MYTDAVPEGYWVHDLEHGAVVVLYRCPGDRTGCPEITEPLRRVYAAAPPGNYGQVKMVVTRYPGLRTPVAALAWNRIPELDAPDEGRLLDFYRAYVDRGPEDVP